ncbi:MAG: C4-type zinc ribbon domain-containing protein [bacterium]
MPDVIEMHLKLLFDLDNLIDDMEDPSYKSIGFKIEDEASLVLIRKRNELLKKLPEELARAYEILKKRYRQAIAPVENDFCLGCFQKLPTELLTRSKDIITCPNCGRILYWRKK